ncbi:MAG TPA: membrane dipeptidase [Chitinophagales bacterium]|nr:membrane dipeptidase [Chitinophagales bacterium]
MTNNDFTIDLHCHPNLKSFNSGFPEPRCDMWEKITHKIEGRFAERINERSHFVLKESQCNLYAMAKGAVRVFNVSLYPTERGFLHLRNVPKFLIGKNKINTMQQVITGYDMEAIIEQKKHYQYFEDLQREYRYLYEQQGKSPDGKWRFKLANNFNDLKEALAKPEMLVGIVSIEGGHVLGAVPEVAEGMSGEEIAEAITKNIKAIKNWQIPPFTINIAHHFWNGLCGHATSFKPPINSIVNQNKGKNKGINQLGWHAIRLLLGRENGKRVIIDTKHMSLEARKEYYAFIDNYNAVNPADTIPILVSHAGVNGFSTMDSSIAEKDVAAKTKKHRLHRWSINLSNEEIRIIHRSHGLVGLMMDRGILGGTQAVQKISAMADIEHQRRQYCKLFWDNAFQFAKAVEDKTAWDIVAFGSDFDGTITHMDPYESAEKVPLLMDDLVAYLEETGYNEPLWYGYSPQQLVRKLSYQNAMRFYGRFFV